MSSKDQKIQVEIEFVTTEDFGNFVDQIINFQNAESKKDEDQ